MLGRDSVCSGVQPRIWASRRLADAGVLGFGRGIAPASDIPESDVYSRTPACMQKARIHI